MTRVTTRLAPALTGLLLPLAALASEVEAGHGGGEGLRFFWEWLNLLILVGALVYLARRPVQTYLAERRGRIEGDLASAARLLGDAEARLADWNARAARLDAEAEDIRRAAREAAEQERERILADARAVAERIQRDAHSALDRELQRARGRLRSEVADLAVELAEKLLREQVQGADRARLVDEFVARIEPGAGERAGGRA
jgi:F-type H+-transporting ATPase subunit b